MSAALSSEFKESVHALLREGGLQLIPDYILKVMTHGNLEDRRKAIELIIKTTGAEAEKKADPNSGLPVFNFVFHAATGQMQMQAVAPVVEEVPIAIGEKELVTLDMGASRAAENSVTSTPSEPDDFMADLDAMLGNG